ncbi:MAG TPA: endolytic transglycosylase MltG [Candidatus Methylomirabilis sp.]|nr:endolytic transglycosylase MltG [Candidatus Methylomirabilis sp.]
MKKTLLLVVALLLAAGSTGAWVWYCLTKPYQGFAQGGVFVAVPRGASARGVGHLLERNGVVRSALVFEIYARRHPKRAAQAGEYLFDRPLTSRDVFWKLAKGEVYQVPFTVREGETIYDIARDLEAGHFMLADDFLKAATDPMLVRDIAPHAMTLEGFLFPATYQLPRHPAATDLTAMMVKKFKEEWNRISQPVPRSDQPQPASSYPVSSILTLASLVERETPKPEERPLVAGVFENRLRKDMRLQCDPTVIYALEQEGRYTGSLTTTDLQVHSPYNTYEHTGLPPGPIGNPGEASLRAALQPAKTDYLYFVANTQGGHFFSATLAEHNRNVTKYRRLLAGLPADPPPPPPKPKARPKPRPRAQQRAVSKKRPVSRKALSKQHKGTTG